MEGRNIFLDCWWIAKYQFSPPPFRSSGELLRLFGVENLNAAIVGAFPDVEAFGIAVKPHAVWLLEILDNRADILQTWVKQHQTIVVIICHNDIVVIAQCQVTRAF